MKGISTLLLPGTTRQLQYQYDGAAHHMTSTTDMMTEFFKDRIILKNLTTQMYHAVTTLCKVSLKMLVHKPLK
jgi:hypothetical protein